MKYAEAEPYPGRGNRTPNGVVIHAMGEWLDFADHDMYCIEYLRKIGLGAHYFVTPTGTVIKCGDDNHILYHAKGANRTTIGIELMVPGLHTMETFLGVIKDHWCPDVQFYAAAELTAQLCATHEIEVENVKRHSDITSRKSDPGAGFEWKRFCDRVSMRRALLD